ncbi:MAG: GNAT family N-acetyltransferase [Candidatus Binatia bacterium]
MPIEPVTLEGTHVRLEPLALAHAPQLWAASDHAELWKYTPYVLRSEDDLRGFIAAALRQQELGLGLSFATIDRGSGATVGATSYLAYEPAHRRVEIGGTWITPARQRGPLNSEAKLLMLRHAFETLGLLRVEFKTDSLNSRSRTAILRLGASEEGIFRNHMVMPDGRNRHSAYYSIIADEWPAVRTRLEGFV